jgi:hypothetical protein
LSSHPSLGVPRRLFPSNVVNILLACVLHAPPTLFCLFDHTNNMHIWRRLQIMKLLVLQWSASSYYVS